MKNVVGGACSAHGRGMKCIQNIGSKSWWEEMRA